MGAKRRELSTPGSEPLGVDAPELPERWSAARKTELVLRLLRDELLARGRYERRAAVDAPVGYRNGFGKLRRLSLSNGTITLQRPRVRGLSERFESQLLPAFKRRTAEVGRLLPELYLHGLAHGD